MSLRFVHLRMHSEYSLVDGIVRFKDLVKRALEEKMPALAMTDRMNLFGLVKFYQKLCAAGIKPIIGADLIIKEEDQFYLATVLCKNEIGYANLRELISLGYLEGQVKGVPTISRDQLLAHKAGFIVLSGAMQGDIGKALLADDHVLAADRLAFWQKNFSGDFYIELQRLGRPNEGVYLQGAMALAEQHEVPVVATNDVRFMSPEDFQAHEARVCIHAGNVLNDPKRPKKYTEQQYFRTASEMEALFADVPEALENTIEIAKRCTVTLTLGKPCLPQFPTPDGLSLEDFIALESKRGLGKRLSQLPLPLSDEQKKAYDERLEIELSVINNMGFPGYFLIVADFIRWAKENDIPVGPGRGSGAGSLVAYCLGVTELDPLEHELLFERFLNPERISMPDFDVDFCMDNRDRVIDYVAERYGRDAVSQIITFGTMAAKAVVRDVGRVMGFPYGFVDKIAKLIPFELGITLDKALTQEEELAKRYETDEEVRTLIDLARKLEGIARNAGKHAGGVVISPTKLTDFSPVYCESGSTQLVTQFDKDDVEAAGLVKFDFLGLRTLTIIKWAVDAVNAKRERLKEAPIDIEKIPTDDKQTFALLQSCATTAVFQLESRGMKDLIRRLQPDCFDDITALVALFRPGPLQSGMVDDFIDRKHGRAEVAYFHPDIEGVLKPTYGVILYQEQVMQIAQVLAGYSLGGADILRRAMGKKKPEEMAKQRKVFVDGASGRGIDEKTSGGIFDIVEKFAGYGFNKSHSAAYALLSYQTAWLKAHYPAEFMAAVLSSDMDNTDKVVGFYQECMEMKLTVLKPDINSGRHAFFVNDDGKIVYGLGAIKGVGESAVINFVQEREQNGLFKDLFDFCARVDLHKVSRRTLEPLIRSGAMDGFGQSRATLLASINRAIKAADQQKKNASLGQHDLFGAVSSQDNESRVVDYVIQPESDDLTRLEGEKETLGMYLSGHPIQIYEHEIDYFTTCRLGELNRHMGKSVTVAGLLIGVRRVITKSGRRMGIVMLEDRTGIVEMTLFSKLFEEVSPYLEKNKVFVVSGKVEEDSFNNQARLVLEAIDDLDNKRTLLAKRLVIFAENAQEMNEWLEALPTIMLPFKGGSCPVFLDYKNNEAKARIQLGDDWQLTPKNALLSQLKELCGKDRVKVGY